MARRPEHLVNDTALAEEAAKQLDKGQLTITTTQEGKPQIMVRNQPPARARIKPTRRRRDDSNNRPAKVSSTTSAGTRPNSPIDFKALFRTDFDAEKWLLWPFVQEGHLGALYAPPKAGKSLVLLDFIVQSLRHSPKGVAPSSPLCVLYLDRENSRRDIARRLQSLGAAPKELGNLKYICFPQLDWLDTSKGGEQLLCLAEKHGANLVVLDSVSRFVQGAENEASTWNALYAHSLAPLKAAGIASLRVDHTGKHEERGMRGSSAKASDVDSAWSLAHDANAAERTLTRSHTRDGMGPGVVTLRVLHEPLEHRVVDTETSSEDLLAEQLRRLGYDARGTREKARALLKPYGVPLPNAQYGKVKKLLSDDDAHGQ